jgi:hypothetical protein
MKTWKINSYAAVLLITVAGATAAMFIVRIAYDDTIATTFNGSEASYSSLQQQILNQ